MLFHVSEEAGIDRFEPRSSRYRLVLAVMQDSRRGCSEVVEQLHGSHVARRRVGEGARPVGGLGSVVHEGRQAIPQGVAPGAGLQKPPRGVNRLSSAAARRTNHWHGTGVWCEDAIGGRLRTGAWQAW
jgi:hypothetical protein